jgi:predicted NUDIX family NTP pyrophosphohydrolase
VVDPKGEAEPGEDLLGVARRELREEVGVDVDGTFLPLSPVRQAGGKVVHAWAVEADVDANAIVSNTYQMEWPPRSGRQQRFPEVDRAAWFDVAEARRRILSGQVPLVDELTRRC